MQPDRRGIGEIDPVAGVEVALHRQALGQNHRVAG
jgi:hypothetical protein